jgi:sec-independent protein translocase protein TatA
MFGLGTTELLIIGFIVFVLFGAKRLPEVGKGLGGAVREFRNIKKEIKADEPAAPTQVAENKGDQQQAPATLEDELTKKVLEQVPGVKRAMDVKDKVDKVKKIIG